MRSYIQGEITVTPAQLEKAKAKARKKMRYIQRHPARQTATFSLYDTFCHDVLMGTMADLDIYLVENGQCYHEYRDRLVTLCLDESWAMDDYQSGIWKQRSGEDCGPAALDALVDEIIDATLEFLGIRVEGERKNRKLRAA